MGVKRGGNIKIGVEVGWGTGLMWQMTGKGGRLL